MTIGKPFPQYSLAFLLAILLTGGWHLQASAALQFLDDEAEPQVNVSYTLKPAPTGRFTLVFDYRDAQNFYALDCVPGAIKLRAVKDNATESLGQSTLAWKPDSKVTLKRRPWLMQVVVNDEVVLTAYDAAFEDGQIGWVAEGWSWQNERVQPVEELYFADDFTRAEGENGVWKTVAGQWKSTASSENINVGNSGQSSNPFSYQATGSTETAIVTAGRWFWDNYEAAVSVRPAGRGTIGLAAYVQEGGRDYLALVWDATEGPAARRLIRMKNGQAQTLAQAPGAYLPRQWYRLAVRTSPGYVEALIDGVPILRAPDNSFGQGGIGLLAQNVTANFDDAKVRSYDYYRQDFAVPGALKPGGAWHPLEGVWNVQQGSVASGPAQGDYVGRTRVLLAGREEWSGYQMSTAVATGEKGGGGLVAGYRDSQNYIVFRWAGAGSTLPFNGRQQLLRYQDGKAVIVSDEPARILAQADQNGWANVTMKYSEGALTVYSGGGLIAQTADETLTSGRAGFYAQGVAPVRFRDVTMFFPPEPEKPKVAPKMEDDSYMVGWASPAGEWPPTKIKDSLEYWNTGEFFGDSTLIYPWQLERNKRGKLEFSLDAKRGDFSSGTIISAAGAGNASSLKLAIARGGTVLRQAEWKSDETAATGDAPADDATPDTVPLKVEQEGNSILVSVDGQPVLSYVPDDKDAKAQGTRIAARTSDMPLRAGELIALSSNRDDFTFTSAPTEWYAPQGSWSVFSRWPCFSNWSFFGGKGVAPVLWSKRTYGGDIIVEIYAHNQMDLPKEIGYSHAGDLNITFGGDGKNPASGYSFVTAGWANTRSAILKGSQIVAENKTAKARFAKPSNHNANYHKRWFYIRAEARRATQDGTDGVLVKLSLDDVPLAEYFDPQPLPALDEGRVAFWTNDGTMMIARAKIEAEKMGLRTLPAGLLDAQSPLPTPRSAASSLMPLPVMMDAIPSAVVEAAETDEEWIVRNPNSGGIFAVELRRPAEYEKETGSSWTAKPGSKIEMDLQLPPEAKIDLYAKIDGALHLIELTGNQRSDARAPLLGSALDGESTPASGWQRVSFDLGAALQKMEPSAKEWEIESLRLGALHGDPYRWDGFFGNPLGVAYRIRNARMFE